MTTSAIIRAADAAQLLENPLLREIFADIEQDSLRAWMATTFDATADRERIWTLMKAMQGIRDKLQAVIDDAKIVTARSTEAMS